jgi:hypothetical protein
MEADCLYLPSAHHPDELIMVTSKVRNRKVSRRTAARRQRILLGFCASATVAILALAVMQPAGPASAQDGTQPLAVQPPGSAAPGEPTTDPITNEQIELLRESGLIDKQSRLSEGLLLMDRQLRQAQLVEQLLAVLGPDAEIEVTPGEFKSFADTPAGLQERIEYLELQAELKVAKQAAGVDEDAGSEISEIFGKSGDLSAVITLDGRSKAVAAGDKLADGSVILRITPDGVDLQKSDGTIEVLKAP